jgi:hypothetical protein
MAQTLASRELQEYVLWTALVALFCFGLPFLFPAFALLTLVWLGALLVALDRFDRRGWWVALGAPLALAWPCFLVFFFVQCYRGYCI